MPDQADQKQKQTSDLKNFFGPSCKSVGFQTGRRRAFGSPAATRSYYQNSRGVRVLRPSCHHVSDFQKSLHWKPKPLIETAATADVSSEAIRTERTFISSLEKSSSVSTEAPMELVSNLERLKLLDEPAVYIPEHLKVPEAECTGLNFGSFDTDSESSSGPQLDDCKKSIAEDSHENYDASSVTQLSSSMADRLLVVNSMPGCSQLFSQSAVEASTTHSDVFVDMLPIAEQTTESFKPGIKPQQGMLFSSVSLCPDDNESFGFRQSEWHHSSEICESQPQDVSRANFVPFAGLSPSYRNPVFYPGFERESRLQFSTSHSVSKSSGDSSWQQSQNAGMHRSTLAVGQPSIPTGAYASAQPVGVPVLPYPRNVYSYQFVPSSYAYMQAPYQPPYPENNGYLQPPMGSSFSSRGHIYPPVGSSTAKFPSPHYKSGNGSTTHLIVSAGFGSYQANPSGFADINSSVTDGSVTSYHDMSRLPFKENQVYTCASPQVAPRQLWIQSRDISGMQVNSCSNFYPPGQHVNYMPPSRPEHTHPSAGFSSFSQSTASPLVHQVLQQTGPVGPGTHAGMLLQPNRGPVNWANGHSSLIRN